MPTPFPATHIPKVSKSSIQACLSAMIRELKLFNFRLFGKEVSIRFRPITILIGENNAGKSSIIKFLLMLKQSTINTKGFLAIHGNEVTLGSFNELKTKGKRIADLEFSLTADENISPSYSVFDLLRKCKLQNEKIAYRVKATVTYDKKGQLSGKNQEVSLLGGNELILRGASNISANSTFLYSADEPIGIEETHRKFKEKQASIQEPIRESDFFAKECLRACVERLRYDLQSLAYVSAAREELAAFVPVDSLFLENQVGIMGENTVFQLWKENILNDNEKREFLFEHTKNVLGIDEIVIKKIENQILRCSARNVRSRAKTNLSNFGFGVSQCLPVFVQGLLMPRKSQLVIEQPEAQIHPTAQIEMGSFFVDLWNKYKVGSIIETHSANILLRIRHLIKKGEISTDDISVAYLSYKRKTPVIINLDIKDDGTRIEGLPMEFFGGDLKEVLKMNAPNAEDG